MLMLGSVKEVTDFEVTVSLPCGLQGFLSIKNISDAYTKLLTEQLDSANTEVGLPSMICARCGSCITVGHIVADVQFAPRLPLMMCSALHQHVNAEQ